jgi:hypothetical protein
VKKLFFIVFLLAVTLRAVAPGHRSLFILEPPAIEPYSRLIYAIGMVEGKGDTLTFNDREKATGYFQIRPIRLEDYNKRTGNHYTLKDMFNYKISKKIFLYYAAQIGPYDYEKISRNWNGSGVKTFQYWKKVKKYL